jgi:hypothetical protein
MPSSKDAPGLETLLNKSMYARVMYVGGSSLRWMPYFVAVISKKDISRLILFKADIKRSSVRYMGWNWVFGTGGNRILAMSAPMN